MKPLTYTNDPLGEWPADWPRNVCLYKMYRLMGHWTTLFNHERTNYRYGTDPSRVYRDTIRLTSGKDKSTTSPA